MCLLLDMYRGHTLVNHLLFQSLVDGEVCGNNKASNL